jgi:hypothetical protein
MQKFIKYITALALISLAISTIVAYSFEKVFLSKSTTRSGYKLERFYKFQDDVVFLGSSRAQQTFIIDTIFTKGDAYNYGLDGTGNWLWRYQLEDLIHNDRKEVIIINVDPPSLDLVTDWNALEFLYLPKESAVFQNLDPSIRRSIGYFPFNYFGSYLELFRTGIKEWVNITSYQSKGTHISTKKNIEGMFYARSFAKDSILRCSGAAAEHLISLFNLPSNDQIVFIKTPTYGGQLQESFFRDLQPLLADHPNIHFLDHSNRLQRKELWYDHVHFTLEGAGIYSKLLREELQALVNSNQLELPRGVELSN